jgi:hypothetical protein
MYDVLYVMYICVLNNLVFLISSIWIWILVFHCVTSSEHEVKLRKHGHGVNMSSSLYVAGLEGLWTRV